MTESWVRAVAQDALREKGHAVFRHEGRQIAIFRTADGVFACNNRCPHEGYPLSEGTLSPGGGCTLTCNWHNWKFDLRTGENAYGGDRLRVYPVALRDGAVWVDIADPPAEERRAEALASLHEAFDDNDYERMAREIARLRLAGGDPVDALRAAVRWSWDRLEFGWTHAYAGAADWLALHDSLEDDEGRLICLVEAVGHFADDVLRRPSHPYPEGVAPFDEDAFVRAVEAEDEAEAVVLMRGALADGVGDGALDRAQSCAALLHYADFGHALIYASKAVPLAGRLGADLAEPLLLSMVRSLVYAYREDQIPEFRGYAPALAAWGGGEDTRPEPEDYRALNISRFIELTASRSGAAPEDIYRALLMANAGHMLRFDLAYQDRVNGPIGDSVGWLSFTHGLTFAHAVRSQCERHPDLWPAGLLQMACFVGRNAPYTLAEAKVEDDLWAVAAPLAFLDETVDGVLDHGRGEFIVSVHLLKTAMAARAEAAACPAAAPVLAAALNRFLASPLKRRHARRTARQAMAFVALDA